MSDIKVEKLNWEPLGRKVKAALMEADMSEKDLIELAEVEMAKLWDGGDGLEDPYDIMFHTFGLGPSDREPADDNPHFVIAPGEHERTLRIDMVRFEDVTDEVFPDGIPDDHPLAQARPDGGFKSIKFPVPDYDEDKGDMH